MSGWNETFLQNVLDKCDNDSLAAMPNAFCDDFLTFRDAPKCSDDDCDFSDPDLLAKLKAIQPSLKDFKEYISPEEISQVKELPRGTCTGTLYSRAPTPAPVDNTPAPTPAPVDNTPAPNNNSTPTKSPTEECVEKWKTKFFLRPKKKNGEVVGARQKSCNWLAKKKKKGKKTSKKSETDL